MNKNDINRIIKSINDRNDEQWKFFINPDNEVCTKYLVSTKGRIYNTNKNIFVKEYNYNKIKKRNKKGDTSLYNVKPRNRVSLYDKEADLSICASPGRIVMMTFNPINDYKNMEIDHKDGNPLNNCIENLEWVTHLENMKRAVSKYKKLEKYNGIGGFHPKYDNELIHTICNDICNGFTRKQIMKKYNINGQLIDDIRSGRSHKDISEKYIDKGFEYKIINHDERRQRQKLIHKICKLIDKGYSNKDIILKLKLPKNEICLPNDIRKYRIYKYISKEYKFVKNV